MPSSPAFCQYVFFLVALVKSLHTENTQLRTSMSMYLFIDVIDLFLDILFMILLMLTQLVLGCIRGESTRPDNART